MDGEDRGVCGVAVSTPLYVQLRPDGDMPSVTGLAPFRAVVIVDAIVTPQWQRAVSESLVRSGCLWMIAWGIDSSSWDDSVDCANLGAFDYREIPDETFVMTSWHHDKPLSEAFDFCKRCAEHPTVALATTVLLHISLENREQEICRLFSEAGAS